MSIYEQPVDVIFYIVNLSPVVWSKLKSTCQWLHEMCRDKYQIDSSNGDKIFGQKFHLGGNHFAFLPVGKYGFQPTRLLTNIPPKWIDRMQIGFKKLNETIVVQSEFKCNFVKNNFSFLTLSDVECIEISINLPYIPRLINFDIGTSEKYTKRKAILNQIPIYPKHTLAVDYCDPVRMHKVLYSFIICTGPIKFYY